MIDEVVIKSSRSAGELRFSEPKPSSSSHVVEYCRITLKDRDIATSSARIYDPAGVAALFDGMQAARYGWEGVKQWSSVDNDFTLACEFDARGVVAMTATLRGPYHEGEWCVQVVIHVGASGLEELAGKVRQFMHL
jgi:hypothetical protein